MNENIEIVLRDILNSTFCTYVVNDLDDRYYLVFKFCTVLSNLMW